MGQQLRGSMFSALVGVNRDEGGKDASASTRLEKRVGRLQIGHNRPHNRAAFLIRAPSVCLAL